MNGMDHGIWSKSSSTVSPAVSSVPFICLLWVGLRHQCLLCAQKQKFPNTVFISAKCHKRTYRAQRSTQFLEDQDPLVLTPRFLDEGSRQVDGPSTKLLVEPSG